MTPAGTSNELDVQNGWEENTHTHTQMLTVSSKNHGFKLFAVMVFTLSRQKMDGSGETRFAAVRFTVPGQVCDSVTVRFTIDFRLSLRVGFGPVCTHSASSIFLSELRHLPCLQLKACFHRFVPTLPYFDIHRLPSSRLYCRLHILDALASSFLLRCNDGVVLLKPLVGIPGSTSGT